MATQARKPVRPVKRRRTTGEVLTGIGAIVVLLVLLAGVPAALIGVFGLPIPHSMPSASLFTHHLEPATILRACSVVVWLAWLQFVWCVIAEVTAAVRNTGMPSRVPLAGGIQPLVHRLVSAALLLSAAAALAPALAPVAASAADRPASASAAASAPAIPGQSFPAAMVAAPVPNGAEHPPGEIAAALSQGGGPAQPAATAGIKGL